MYTLIKFEDWGQDFLYWIYDTEGCLIWCSPFQYDIWKAYKIELLDYKAGQKVSIYKESEFLTVNYPIELVKNIQNEEELAQELYLILGKTKTIEYCREMIPNLYP